MAFLNDIICPPMSKFVSHVWEDSEGAEGEAGEFTGDMPADDQGLERRTITYTQYIEYVFTQYNLYQTKASRKLHLRNYNPEWDATIVYESDYKTCLEVLRSEILPKMGGYLVASKDATTGYIMIDITTNFGTSNQPIRAGTNLLDYMSTHNPFYTAVIAKGGNPDNDYSTGTEPVKMDQPMYYDSLYILSRYGVICAYKEFPECTTLTDLEARCTEFLDSQQFEDYSLDLSATDLHIINDEYDLLKVGKSVVFSSPKHHETPVSLLITSMEIHLDTGEKKLKLGSSKKRTITRDVTKVNVKVENNQTVVGDDIIVEDSVIEGSSNPISSGAVYDALQGGGGGGGGGDGWIHQINGVTQETGTINFVTGG